MMLRKIQLLTLLALSLWLFCIVHSCIYPDISDIYQGDTSVIGFC